MFAYNIKHITVLLPTLSLTDLSGIGSDISKNGSQFSVTFKVCV